jgi:hypothetical protein
MVLLLCIEKDVLLVHRPNEEKGDDMESRYPVSGVLCFYLNVMERVMKDLFPSRNRILTSSLLGSIVFRSQQAKKYIRSNDPFRR